MQKHKLSLGFIHIAQHIFYNIYLTGPQHEQRNRIIVNETDELPSKISASPTRGRPAPIEGQVNFI